MPSSSLAMAWGAKLGSRMRRCSWCSGGSLVIGGDFLVLVPGGRTPVSRDEYTAGSWVTSSMRSHVVGMTPPP